MRKAILLLLLPLTACTERNPAAGGKYTIETSIYDKDAAGRDSDGNGIRDDIDLMLRERPEFNVTPEARKYSENLARAFQPLAASTPEDEQEAIELLDVMGLHVACFIYKFPEDSQDDAFNLIKISTFNTIERLKNMEEIGNLAGGTSFSSKGDSECF